MCIIDLCSSLEVVCAATVTSSADGNLHVLDSADHKQEQYSKKKHDSETCNMLARTNILSTFAKRCCYLAKASRPEVCQQTPPMAPVDISTNMPPHDVFDSNQLGQRNVATSGEFPSS
jgi:hypothetical protein